MNNSQNETEYINMEAQLRNEQTIDMKELSRITP